MQCNLTMSRTYYLIQYKQEPAPDTKQPALNLFYKHLVLHSIYSKVHAIKCKLYGRTGEHMTQHTAYTIKVYIFTHG